MSTEVNSCKIKEIETLGINRYEGISRILNAMSNKTRLAILHAMTEHKEVCTCELQPALQLPQSTITTHLRKMYDVGLLERREVWKYSYYSVDPEYEELVNDILKSHSNAILPERSAHSKDEDNRR